MTTFDDRRFWILDPRGHRVLLDAHYAGRDGELVDGPFGPATLIVTPSPPGDEWICDFCNQDILTRWGEEPFPVPMFGGYALCVDHYNDVIATWTHDDPHTGESSGVLMGDWPQAACGCDACIDQFEAWEPYLRYAIATERV